MLDNSECPVPDTLEEYSGKKYALIESVETQLDVRFYFYEDKKDNYLYFKFLFAFVLRENSILTRVDSFRLFWLTMGEIKGSSYLHLLFLRPVVVMEKAMAPHSSTLAWKIPWTEEPGRLQSMGSLGVGYDWVTSLSLFTFMHWRRKWQPTPVFLPGESQGRGSLVGCRLWGRTDSDTTEAT